MVHAYISIYLYKKKILKESELREAVKGGAYVRTDFTARRRENADQRLKRDKSRGRGASKGMDNLP